MFSLRRPSTHPRIGQESLFYTTCWTPPKRVSGDEVTLATIGEPAAACGTLQAASVTTDQTGRATLTYSRSATAGFCAVFATEQRTGQAGFTMVDQEPVTSASATRDTVAVAASGRSAAGGGSAAALTVAVETRSGAAVAGDAVWLTPYGVGCGSLSANVGITDGSGRLTVGYTAAAAGQGSCTVVAEEADTGATAGARLQGT